MDAGTIIFLIVGLLVGIGVGYVLYRYQSQKRGVQLQIEAQRSVEEAQTRAKEAELAARDEAMRLRDEADKEIKRRRADIQREEERLARRREQLDQKIEQIEQRERKQSQRQSQLDKQANDLAKIEQQRMAELARIAQISPEDARKELLATVEKTARDDMARVIRQVEAEIKEEADKRAREIITLAIQRVGSETAGEIAVSVVPLPSDEMKGRIIGRSGRNIRAIEKATGVDIVVDDTPEAVTLSSFDPVRREVARLALTKLIMDGRIHPARIEKLVEDSQAEVDRTIKEEGERAAIEAGVPGLHPEVLKKLGRLKFRTSYGQNQLLHAIETARLAGIMAAELGADVKVCKGGGLLHDLGKAMDHEMEGTHALLGADYARRYGVDARVVNCIASHHHEVETESLEAVIVEAADAISGSRPGARRESIELYLKRVKDLEDIASSFEGVSQSYAIQAGREIRIVVRPEDIDDLAALQLSKNIARKIEETMQYPGQIKVTVIRETRAVDYAK
ncbi:MAG TPA: ribonuclease Y [Anaerolineae bacterium]|nr:ribonuclease Y [Anaerolineae bacterium]